MKGSRSQLLQCVDMSSIFVPAARRASASAAGARHLYSALLGEHGPGVGLIDEVTKATSRAFLVGMLESADLLDDGGLPRDPRNLADWLALGHEQTTRGYREYLDARKAGAPRRFFRNRSHALHFLKSVAPTKLVDGAWLFGLVSRWDDARLAPLIRIYLEELGDGRAAQHHVLLYRKLLAEHGATRWNHLDDRHHVQGAVQLSLAHHAAEFLPEVIGFNLGYEQLPLHLPITAYELNELDIDPYYFSLHVTIDNGSTGHARKALQCALDCLPRVGDTASFYRRMMTGYKLNDVGMGTVAAMGSFDLERELLSVLADKGRLGAELHSDYCRIAGRTVTDWLSAPGGIPAFLAALVDAGWIRRGVEPRESRFWRLLSDEGAAMFGVFDAFELQLIHDWIVAGGEEEEAPGTTTRRPHVNRFRRRPAANAGSATVADAPPFNAATSVAAVVRYHLTRNAETLEADPDAQALAERLADIDDLQPVMAELRGFLSPANHPTPTGLLATGIFSDLLGHR